MTPIIDDLHQPVNQPDLPVNAAQNQRPNVRRQRPTVELARTVLPATGETAVALG